jgi:hypothetical protein
MPSYQFVLNFLFENLEGVTFKGNQFNARCPICGDSAKSTRKKRFNLKYNDRSTVFHCFNCNESGDFYKLYSLVKNVSTAEAFRVCESIDSLWSNGNFFDRFKLKEESKEVQSFNWILDDCFSEYNQEPGIIYEAYVKLLKSFRQERNIPTKIPLFIAYRGKYKSRIIIPVFDNMGNLVYFQARATTSIQPKYLNPDFPKEMVIPNFDFIEAGPVFVTEGLLDCYSIGRQSTACLGKEITDTFINRLKQKVVYAENIIIALDNDLDGIKATVKLMKNSNYGKQMRYFFMPEKYKKIKDINQLSIVFEGELFTFLLNNTVDYSKAVSILKTEKWRLCENEINYSGQRFNTHR